MLEFFAGPIILTERDLGTIFLTFGALTLLPLYLLFLGIGFLLRRRTASPKPYIQAYILSVPLFFACMALIGRFGSDQVVDNQAQNSLIGIILFVLAGCCLLAWLSSLFVIGFRAVRNRH